MLLIEVLRATIKWSTDRTGAYYHFLKIETLFAIMSEEESQYTEMSSVKDLVEEHFARALSSTTQSSTENTKDNQDTGGSDQAKQTRNTLKQYLKSPPANRESGKQL